MRSNTLVVLVVLGGAIAYIAYRNARTSAYWDEYTAGADAKDDYWTRYVAGLGS